MYRAFPFRKGSLVYVMESFDIWPGACTIKHGFLIYGFRSKLVCLSKPMKMTDNRQTLAYYEIS